MHEAKDFVCDVINGFYELWDGLSCLVQLKAWASEMSMYTTVVIVDQRTFYARVIALWGKNTAT